MIKTKLLAKHVAWSIVVWVGRAVNLGFQFIMAAVDPGNAIFRWMDARDNMPNNGYFNG